MHGSHGTEPSSIPASSFLSNRWRHGAHTCRAEAEWVPGLAFAQATPCSKICTHRPRPLNQWLLWSSELQTHIDNLLLRESFWLPKQLFWNQIALCSSLCLPISGLCLSLFAFQGFWTSGSQVWDIPGRPCFLSLESLNLSSGLLICLLTAPQIWKAVPHHHLKFSHCCHLSSLSPVTHRPLLPVCCHLAGRAQIINLILPAPF